MRSGSFASLKKAAPLQDDTQEDWEDDTLEYRDREPFGNCGGALAEDVSGAAKPAVNCCGLEIGLGAGGKGSPAKESSEIRHVFSHECFRKQV